MKEREIVAESKIYPRSSGFSTVLVFSSILPFLGILAKQWILGGSGAILGTDEFFPSTAHLITCTLCSIVLVWPLVLSREERILSGTVPRGIGAASVVLGIAAAVSGYYCLAMLIVVPMMFCAIVAFGLGILGLAPYWCFLGTLMQVRRYLALWPHLHPSPGSFERRLVLGFFLGLIWMVAIDGRAALLERTLELAVSKDSEWSPRAIVLLRTLGSQDELLHRCYSWRGRTVWSLWESFAWSGRTTMRSIEDIRKVFFRVYGHPFNAFSPPASTALDRGQVQEDSWETEWVYSRDVGGENVSGRVRGLSLSSSRIDGVVDPVSAVAQFSWTFEFSNGSSRQREARARIALPPGGAASQLSLWINGEECQAAFGGRSQVRQAYQKVAVVQRRDPALLTSAGPDEVMLQVFPIQPRSTGRVRIGITAPVILEGEQALVRLPTIIERNFDLARGVRHLVWLETPEPDNVQNPEIFSITPGTGRTVSIRGQVDDSRLLCPRDATLRFRIGPPRSALTFSKDADGLATQEILACGVPRPVPALVLVVDGSATMIPLKGNWSRIVSRLPPGLKTTVLLAGDRVDRWDGNAGTPGLSSWLESRFYAGGIDPVPALEMAWETAVLCPGTVVVWLHGLQSVSLSSVEGLTQRLAHRPEGPILVPIAAAVGPNVVREALGSPQAVCHAPRLGNLEDDLARALSCFDPSLESIRRPALSDLCVLSSRFGSTVRLLGRQTGAPPSGAQPCGNSLSRLWALTFSRRLARHGDEEKARQVALRFRLVTPLTGAVVLERKEDYAKNDLDPTKPSAVPVKGVPEPDVLLLTLVSMLVIGCWQRWHSVRAVAAGQAPSSSMRACR